MKLKTALVEWTPTGQEGKVGIRVGLLPRYGGGELDSWPDRYACTWGGCNSYVRLLDFKETLEDILMAFNRMVTDYALPVDDVHREFMKLDEYRQWKETGMEAEDDE